MSRGRNPPVWSPLTTAPSKTVICVNNTKPNTGGKLVRDPCVCMNGGACVLNTKTKKYQCDCSKTGRLDIALFPPHVLSHSLPANV